MTPPIHNREEVIKRVIEEFDSLRGYALTIVEKLERRSERAEERLRTLAEAVQKHLDTFGYDNHEGLADALAASQEPPTDHTQPEEEA